MINLGTDSGSSSAISSGVCPFKSEAIANAFLALSIETVYKYF